MKIKIYQVNMERDENRVAFMGYDSLSKFQGSSDVDSKIYDKVFEGKSTALRWKSSMKYSIGNIPQATKVGQCPCPMW